MELPPTLAAETAILRQNIALSVIKSAAQADKAVANILEQSLTVGPAQRGGNINFSA
jgi:hypothetical protein